MKQYLLIFIYCLISCLTYEWLRKDSVCPETTLQLNPEAQFILESVENDSLMQNYIYSPTYRLRVREAKKYFDKKFPTN